MSLITKDSPIVSSPLLDLHAEIPTDPSFQEMYQVPIRPSSNVLAGGDVSFEVIANSEEYLHLAATYLEFGLQIVNTATGEPIKAGTDQVGVINNAGQSFWQSLKVWLGNKLVMCNDNQAMLAYFVTLLSYGTDAKSSHLTSQLYYKDTAGHMNDLPGRGNTGLNQRAKYFEKGEVVWFRIRLIGSIFTINKVIPSMVPVRITLKRSSPEFFLMAGKQGVVTTNSTNKDGSKSETVTSPGTAPAFGVNLVDPVLWVTKVRLLPSVFNSQNEALQAKPAVYKMVNMVIRDENITANQKTVSIEKALSGQVPRRFIYAVADHDAVTGDYSKNAFNFEHADVCQTAAYINGRCHPQTPYTPDYDNGRFIREYACMLEGAGIKNGNRGLDISRGDFPKGYCVYVVDATQNQSASDPSHVNLIFNGDVRLTFNFVRAPSRTMSCIVFAEYDNIMTIDHDRNVSLNYAP